MKNKTTALDIICNKIVPKWMWRSGINGEKTCAYWLGESQGGLGSAMSNSTTMAKTNKEAAEQLFNSVVGDKKVMDKKKSLQLCILASRVSSYVAMNGIASLCTGSHYISYGNCTEGTKMQVRQIYMWCLCAYAKLKVKCMDRDWETMKQYHSSLHTS